MSRLRLTALVPAIPAALIVLVVGPSVIRGHIPWFMDIVAQFYPIRFTAAQTIHEGLIPLWNPHYYCGVPLLANPQWGVLSPANWLFFLAPIGHTFMLGYLIHHIILAGGGYWLARTLGLSRLGALASGLVMGLGGWTWAHYPFGAYLAAVCWAPWWLGCLERHAREPQGKWIALCGLLWALQILAGAPQAVFLCSLAYGAMVVMLTVTTRRSAPIKLFVGSLLIALVLSAAQWLPTTELLQHTVRGGKLPYEEVQQGTLHLWGERSLLNALIGGNLFHGPEGEDAESTAFVGWLGLCLAVFAFLPGVRGGSGSSKWRYTVLVLLALLWSWSALSRFLHPAVPGYGEFHDPKRALLVVHIALSLLIGEGIDWFARRGDLISRRSFFFCSSLNAALLCTLSVLITRPPHSHIRNGAVRFPGDMLEGVVVSDLFPAWLSRALHWLPLAYRDHIPENLYGSHAAILVVCIPIAILITALAHRRAQALACTLLAALAFQLTEFVSTRLDTKTVREQTLTEVMDDNPAVELIGSGSLVSRFATHDSRGAYSYRYATRSWRWNLLPDQACLAGLLDSQGFDPTIPARARAFYDVLNEGHRSLYTKQFCLIRNWDSPLIDLLAVRWTVGDPPGGRLSMPADDPPHGRWSIGDRFREISDLDLPGSAYTDELGSAFVRGYSSETVRLQASWPSVSPELLSVTLGSRLLYPSPDGEVVFQGETFTRPPHYRLFENTTAQPRLVHRTRFRAVPDLSSALSAARVLGEEIRDVTVLELPDLRPAEYRLPPAAEMELISFAETPNTVTVDINAPPGWIVLRDQILPGWRAWIDEDEVEIVPADILFRAVEWPGGRHTLRFAHEPTSFRLGWFLSLAAISALVAMTVGLSGRKTVADRVSPQFE